MQHLYVLGTLNPCCCVTSFRYICLPVLSSGISWWKTSSAGLVKLTSNRSTRSSKILSCLPCSRSSGMRSVCTTRVSPSARRIWWLLSSRRRYLQCIWDKVRYTYGSYWNVSLQGKSWRWLASISQSSHLQWLIIIKKVHYLDVMLLTVSKTCTFDSLNSGYLEICSFIRLILGDSQIWFCSVFHKPNVHFLHCRSFIKKTYDWY